MGLFEYNYDADALRAIGHARLQISAGKGLESIVFALASSDVGKISEGLAQPVARMQVGWPAEEVLQDEIEAAENQTFANFLTALLYEGEAAIRRLDELSEEIQLERRLKVEAYGQRLSSALNVIAITFIGAFAPIFLKVLELIPENGMIPTLTLPPAFYAAYFFMLSAIISVMLLGMRYSD